MMLIGLLSIWVVFAIFVIVKGKGFFLAFAGGFAVMLTSLVLLIAYEALSKTQAITVDVADFVNKELSAEVVNIPQMEVVVANAPVDSSEPQNAKQIETKELDLDSRMQFVANITR